MTDRPDSAPDPTAAVIVLTTWPGDRDATALARTLVDERHAACVNLLPAMQSIYRWQGAVEQASEQQLIIKTTAARLARLQARLAELHPYAVPEFLVLPVLTGLPAYLDWLTGSVTDAEP